MRGNVDETDPRAKAFAHAVNANDAAEIRSLFASHPELVTVVDAPWFSFASPALVHAAGTRARDVIDALIDVGADLDAVSIWENGPYSALHRLVDGATPESLELAEHLAARGALVDLHAAAGMGRTDRIREILDAEPGRVSKPGPDGATALHLARTPEVAALLLERGAEIDKRCIDHRSTPAMWAAGDREDVMLFLLERGSVPDLYQAVLLDDAGLVAAILDIDPEALHVRVRFGESHPHIGYGDKYVWALPGADTPVELARQRGADRTYRLLLGLSPIKVRLLQASRRGDEDALRSILGHDKKLLTSLTASELCEMLYGSEAGARILLGHGADPNVRDDQTGATALHHTAWRGLADLTRTLLDGGADVSLRERQHDATPLGWANENDQTEVMELILAHSDPDIVDAAWLGDADRVSDILREDPSLVDGLEQGRISPLRSAAWCGKTEVVRVLLAHGANPTLVNPASGKTALDFALAQGFEEIVQLLSSA
jgi:ankyrin repeat protein